MILNVENFKKNKLVLIVMLVSTALLILFNHFMLNIKTSESKLNDDEIDINKLVINEIMTSNKGAYVDPTGNTYDWVELYNGSSKDINLYNCGLSDREDGSVKWLFPNQVIPANSYLVVYLTGEKMTGLYANLSLSQDGGETVTLKNAAGKVVDTVKTVELEKNTTMARNSKGDWITTSDITPGYQNNEDGRDEYLSGAKEISIKDSLVLTEFLPANDGNILFDNNLYSYIEVTNEGEETINLHDYYVSDDTSVIYKYRLPDTNLEPGKSYLIFTNEKDQDNNANFRLKHHTGTVVLASLTGIIETVNYEELTNGMAYVKTDDLWHQSGNISPGSPNTTAGKIEFQNKYDTPKKDLIISEIMSSNGKYLPQNGNQYYDWIELYNNSNQAINLNEYFITTDKDDQDMYHLPDVTLNPGQYYVLIASGDTSLSNNTYYHTNFKLSTGKSLFIYHEEQITDCLYMYSIPRNNSYGRSLKNGHYYYTDPTPGYKNGDNGIRELSTNPTFSNEGGVYNNTSSLEIKIEGTGTIYYTTDGSIPTRESNKYTDPFFISETTVIRAVSYEDTTKNSDVVTNSYILNQNHQIAVMSVTLPESKFTSLSNNSSSHATTSAHAELYENNKSFSVDCGFKLFGGQSRELSKKSFALKFNSTYGNGKLRYKVFDNKDVVEFNTLVLRSGSQDQSVSMMRDEFNATMQINYGTIDAQAAKPIALYINGKYWGLYYIREKINSSFIENNYNVTSTTNIANYSFSKEEGSNSKIISLKKYVQEHDLNDPEAYEYVKSQLDLENFADYWVYSLIMNATDIHNVRYFYNSGVDNGKIKLIMYDTDYSFKGTNPNYLSFINNPSSLSAKPDTTILNALFKSTEFKKLFCERVSYYMKNVWTEDHINTVYNDLYNSISSEMQKNCARWGTDYNTWLSNAKNFKKNLDARRKQVIAITKNYFNLSEEEVNEYFA